MSTAPQGWQTPKTNWQAADIVHPSDFNRIEGNANAVETGNRTLDPTQAPSGNTGSLRQLLDWFANRIKAITGTTNWYDAPATTLAATKSHMDATSVHGATSSATANRIVIRDSAGRAQFADPSAAQDAATKGYADAAQAYVRNNVMHASAAGPGDLAGIPTWPNGASVPALGGQIARLLSGQTIKIWAVDYIIQENWRLRVIAREPASPGVATDVFLGSNSWQSARATGDAPLASYTAPNTRHIEIWFQNQTGGDDFAPALGQGAHIAYTIE